MDRDYVVKIQNVKCKIGYVGEPKGKGGYSYALNSQDIPQEYLDGKYKSIYLQSYDKEPRFNKGQEVTIAELGITEWETDEGEVRYSAHIINDKKPSIKAMYEKEVEKKKELPRPIQTTQKSNEMSKEEWANKDLVGNYGKCVMYASGCFVPRTNEDGIEPIDRALAICDLAEAIFLQRMYNFNLKDLKAKI